MDKIPIGERMGGVNTLHDVGRGPRANLEMGWILGFVVLLRDFLF